MKALIPSLFGRWVVILITFCATAAAQPPGDIQPPKSRDDTVLVKPKKGVPVAQLAAEHGALGAHVKRMYAELGNLQVVKLPRGLSVKKAIERYQRSGLVEYAEPDYVVNAVLMPNDPKFTDGTLWGLHNTGQFGGKVDADIDGPEAWDRRISADPIIVAVIDTGILPTHEDLAANLWTNPGEVPGNGIDDDANGYVDDVYGINAITNTGTPTDDNGHGTHVAGTVGAVGNNGIGVVGVAWQVRLMACKFLDATGTGYTSDGIECIDYAIAKGADIMNNSWGGSGYSQALADAIARARNAGIIFVAAAGNSRLDNDCSAFYPASYNLDNIVAVAATDRTDALASFSNFGLDSVDLSAPGSSIYSTSIGGTGNAYATLSGTSMATPHVSGALALLAAEFPTLSYSELIYRLLGTVDPLSGLAEKSVTGGRLDAASALTLQPRPIAILAASPKGGEPPLTVAFTDNSLGTITSRSLDFGDLSLPTTTTTTTHIYTSPGTYTATLTVNGPTGTHVKSHPITVANNYTETADIYNWVNTSGLSALTLGDDAASQQLLPFNFTYYGQNYTTVYVGSNGLLVFGSSAGATEYLNSDLPNCAPPNAVVAAYWDDLDPADGGQVRVGTIGAAPNRIFIASWEGVPHFSDILASFTFQVLLFEGSNQVKVQYAEVRPANLTYGSGRSATIGIEDHSGSIARRHSYNSPSLSNGQAILFLPPGGAPPTVELTVSRDGTGDGVVSSSPVGIDCGTDCSESYNVGTAVTLTATPDATSTFTSWSGACSGTNPTCLVTMDTAKPATATFTRNLYTLTVTKAGSGGGTVSSSPAGINCGADCDETYVAGTVVTLTATPDATSTFTGWSGDGTGTNATCAVTIDAAKFVTATFARNTYVLSVNKAGDGSGTVTSSPTGINCGADCSETYFAGTVVTLTATAGSGSVFTGWSGACTGTEPTCAVTMDSAKSTTATFGAVSLNAPANLTATVVTGPKVVLNWTDNSTGETRFEIQHTTKTKNTGWGSFQPLATVGADVTTFTDSSVSKGASYRYRVRACNGACSGFSNTAQVSVP